MNKESSISGVRDSDLFILHANAEHDTRFALSYLLPALQAPPGRILLSSNLPPGQRVASAIERAFAASKMTALLLSPEFLRESWTVFGESLASHQSAHGERPLVPLLLASCELPPRLKMWVSLDLRDPATRDREVRRLREALAHTITSAPAKLARPQRPDAAPAKRVVSHSVAPTAPPALAPAVSSRGGWPQLVRLAWARLR